MRKDELQEVLKLVRIKLTQEEEELIYERVLKITKDMDDLPNHELVDFSDRSNLFRDDVPVDYKNRDKIIANFKKKEGNYLKVKQIL
ncbi:MAG: Asp-tRNA(Asn)/Glu-tRNA(Gln) amidotransferase subunit GatC [Minisyncoccales bacterium]|jgi:aspartyl/glutamyl-tRNA(Asn/Gln) amidotransferase C subunit